MSELINNAEKRKELLKHMILQLHEGTAPEAVKQQLVRLLGKVPYNDVVEVEQELIKEGLPQEEVLKLCDIHTMALDGIIDHTEAKIAPPGHPVHTFKEENRALRKEIQTLGHLYGDIKKAKGKDQLSRLFDEIHQHFNALMDVEKHYLRKENLLFPFLEKHGVTGPPTVMWGKHDETRELLKGAMEALGATEGITVDEAKTVIDLVFEPASRAVEDMIGKEEEILFPMCLDTLSDTEWLQIERQSIEYGFCLYDPKVRWSPEGLELEEVMSEETDRIQLPSGGFDVKELTAILNSIPFDMTFVDKDDKVRYFTQGRERIFARSRAILGRNVRQCHPPSSVGVVERILEDFKSGKEDHTAFWITLGERFIHIEYFALRNEDGHYLGTLEVSQDLTEKRKLEGEQRLLQYVQKDN
ncbi:MAG: DUF438 domain-containing protein [Candidatus Aminicenantes bacterium]|nr:MAG: DUF438 domain-containing protein [Candidatus Aminicenantes bacterium]